MTAATRTRNPEPVDIAEFTTDVQAALTAFTRDVSYAVSMARAAVVIDRKRSVWAHRKAQRANAA